MSVITIPSGVTSSNLTVTDYLHVYGTVLDSLVKSTGRIYVSSGGAALITAADTTTWAEYGALGSEWSTKGVGIL